MKVGWIGLGRMGEAFALRILAAGHEVIGYSRHGRPREALLAAGARLTASLTEVVADVDLVEICVFSDAQLAEVLTGEVYEAMRPGTVVAIHTTGTPALLEVLGAAAPPHVTLLDATFSGAIPQARAGEIRLYVGGDAAALDRVRPVFDAFCAPILQMGAIGDARRLKLINNILFAAQISLAAEALTAIERMGLPIDAALEGISLGSGGSFALNVFRGSTVDATLQRLAEYLDKDVDAARAAASSEGLDLRLLDAAAMRWVRPIATS